MKYSKETLIIALSLAASTQVANANTPTPVNDAYLASYSVLPYYPEDNFRGDLRHVAELPLFGDVLNFDRTFKNVGTIAWQKNRDNTETGNTGPLSASQTSELSGSYYWYFETSANFANKKGDKAILQGPEFSNKDTKLTFDYHMFGRDIGHLSVQALINGQWKTIWSKGGQQQQKFTAPWASVTIDLNKLATTRTKIRFTAKANGGDKGDIALDNIKINSSIYHQRINITYADLISSYEGHVNWQWEPADGVEPEVTGPINYYTPWRPKNDKYSYSEFIIGKNVAGEKKWIYRNESHFFNPYPTPFLNFYSGIEGWKVCEGLGNDIWSISVQVWDGNDPSTASETPVLGKLDCTWI